MEFCHSLRHLFKHDSSNLISLTELHAIVNSNLDKDYSLEQIIIGMDYAGFQRVHDKYRVQVIHSINDTD